MSDQLSAEAAWGKNWHRSQSKVLLSVVVFVCLTSINMSPVEVPDGINVTVFWLCFNKEFFNMSFPSGTAQLQVEMCYKLVHIGWDIFTIVMIVSLQALIETTTSMAPTVIG